VEADRLFLARCKQIETAMQSTNEIELLNLSAYLRQLLIDGASPLHTVNRERRLRLNFVVGEFTQRPSHRGVLSLEDGVDPEIRRPGAPRKELSLGDFLNHTLLYLHGQPRSVSDIINFAANVAGGVHHAATPSEKQKLMHNYSSQVSIGGLPGAIRQLQAIGRVALRGLRPLIEAIENG
jgi:hypothetical protein